MSAGHDAHQQTAAEVLATQEQWDDARFGYTGQYGTPLPSPTCACGGPCEHDGSLAEAQREQLRMELDDAVLMRTGRSVGDIASGQVADDLWPLIEAIAAAAEQRGRDDEKRRISGLPEVDEDYSAQFRAGYAFALRRLRALADRNEKATT